MSAVTFRDAFLVGLRPDTRMQVEAWEFYAMELLSRHKLALVMACVVGFFLGAYLK